MKTYLGYAGKLSQKQITRLGGLIAVVCDRVPYEHILNDLETNNFYSESNLTPEGRTELIRLTAMAGLRPEQFCSDEYMKVLNE